MASLDGKVALITGGGSGIGLAVVDRYIQKGAKVSVLERSDAGVQRLRDQFGDQLIVTQGDASRYEDNVLALQHTLKGHSKLDIFVGNAGIYDFCERLDDIPLDRLSDKFDQLFAVNVKAYVLGARCTADALRASKGCMIFTASSSSLYAGGGGPLYVASKHAVVGLVKQLAFDYAPLIRVNAVAPGATQTSLSGVADDNQKVQTLTDIEGFESMVTKTVPLGFLSKPEDHVGIYTLLASSEQSGFMTAAIIPSDGGLDVRGGGREKKK